jgi:hypothetical protein
MGIETVVLLVFIGALVGFMAGHWTADLRRARSDAARIMRTRSNYRRGKRQQK